MDELEIEQRLTKVEESTKSAHHRIAGMESMQREIRDLAMSVNTLAGSLQNLVGDVSDVTCRIKDIEAKPGKRLDQVIGYIMAALISGMIGFMLSQIMKG